MDLKCKRLDCKFNKQYACTARGILVTNELECSTYENNPNPPKEQKQNVSKTMFSEVPEIHPFRHSVNVNILCEANCLFNKKGVCVANGITIDVSKKGTECITQIHP